VEGVLVPELADQVGVHAAGDLVHEDVDVHAAEVDEDLGVLFPHLFEVVCDGDELFKVDARFERPTLHARHQGLDGRLAGALGEGGDGAVHHVGAGLEAREIGHGGHAAGVVGVDLDGKARLLLDGPDKGGGLHGADDARHVLDADRVGAHGLHVPGELREGVEGVHRRQGEGEGELQVGPFLLDLVGGHFHVPEVVQGIEDPDDVKAVAHGPLDELTDGVVGVVAVSHHVLAPEEHLELRLLEELPEGAEPLPGILVKKAHAGVEGGASPNLHGMEAHVVHHLRDGSHVDDAHAGGHKGLVSVPEARVGDADLAGGSMGREGFCGYGFRAYGFGRLLNYHRFVRFGRSGRNGGSRCPVLFPVRHVLFSSILVL